VTVEARMPRRPLGIVPTWRTLPLPGAVKVVTIALFVTLALLVIGSGVELADVGSGVVVGVVVPVSVVVPLLATVGVTAFDAAEASELTAGVVVFAIAVKV